MIDTGITEWIFQDRTPAHRDVEWLLQEPAAREASGRDRAVDVVDEVVDGALDGDVPD